MIDLYDLKSGDRVQTVDGALVEVLSKTEDGQWIRVRYLERPKDVDLVGSEDLCHVDELQESD